MPSHQTVAANGEIMNSETIQADVAPTGVAFQEGWGVDNSTGRLVDVLIGRPDSYVWRRDLNAISAVTFMNMDRLGYNFDKDRALRQHQAMVQAFTDAGVRCHHLPADAGLTSSVFVRDSSFMTPWGPVVAAIQTEPRRRDYAVVTRFYIEAGVPIWNWVTAGYFEGGDFAIVEPGSILLGYSGTRSTREGAEQVAKWMIDAGWEAMTVPIAPQFVHMDAVVVMVAPKLALVCVDALEDYVLDWLRARSVRMLPVSYRECMRLGGNVVCLGEGRILSTTENIAVNERLRAEGLEVFTVEFEQFTLGGGGLHCSCHEILRHGM
jgi:N-dimethylarginine dimethylaminohydrolase